MLNDLYDVAFSPRTGNARIVLSKRTLLSDTTSKLLDRHSPGWMETTCAGDFVHALQADSDDTVFQSWTEHVQKRSLGGEVVFLVLDVLNDSGRCGDNLLAAFLHHNTESMIDIRTKANDWIHQPKLQERR